MVLECRILPLLIGAGDKGQLQRLPPAWPRCLPGPLGRDTPAARTNTTPTRVSSLLSKPPRLVHIREAKGMAEQTGHRW